MFEHLHYDDRIDWILAGGDRVCNEVVALEGFDHLAPSLTNLKGWDGVFSTTRTSRFGSSAGNGMDVNNGANSATRKFTLPTTYSELYAGFAVFGTVIASNQIFAFRTTGTTDVFKVQVNAAGKLEIRNSAGTVIATGTTILSNSSWYYVEVYCKIAGASGAYELHLNGAVEIANGTSNFGSTNVDSFTVSSSNNPQVAFDDIYVLDTTGGAPYNTFLGDVRVKTVLPNADGAHSQWTPSAAGSHFNKVNETSADGDTTYVSDSTPGDLDTWVYDDIDGGATVYAVQVSTYARKDDASLRQIAPVVRQSGTDYIGTTVTLGASYAFFKQIYTRDPTGAGWTPTTVNGDEFGVKEIA